MFGHFTTLCMKGLNTELLLCCSFLSGIVDLKMVESEEKLMKLKFLCDQMKFVIRYSSNIIREAINLYLRSRNSYQAVRNLLIFPHSKAIKNYFRS